MLPRTLRVSWHQAQRIVTSTGLARYTPDVAARKQLSLLCLYLNCSTNFLMSLADLHFRPGNHIIQRAEIRASLQLQSPNLQHNLLWIQRLSKCPELPISRLETHQQISKREATVSGNARIHFLASRQDELSLRLDCLDLFH
jgi:hypothetical protein